MKLVLSWEYRYYHFKELRKRIQKEFKLLTLYGVGSIETFMQRSTGLISFLNKVQIYAKLEKASDKPKKKNFR